MKHILIFALGLTTLPFFLSAQSSKSIKQKATAESNKGNYELALKYIDWAIAIDSTDGDLYGKKGIILRSLKRHQEAIDAYSKGISVQPTLCYLYVNRGNLLMESQMPNEAISDFNIGLKYANDDTIILSLYENRGVAKINIRDFEGAYKDLSYAYQMDTNDKDILINLAVACDDLNKKDEALKYLLIAHRALPDDGTIISNLGFLYQGMKKYKESIEYFDLFIKMKPTEGVGYSNRSYSRLKLGDTDGALKDINKSIELYPANSYAYRNRGLMWLELKKMASACEDFNTAINKGYTQMYGKDVEDLVQKNCSQFK